MEVNAVNETQIILLAATLTQGVLPSPGDVAFSVTLSQRAGLKLGDKVKLRDQTLTLVGFT